MSAGDTQQHAAADDRHEGYAPAEDIPVERIPVIDIAGLHGGGAADLARIGQELRRAAETVGFFYIRNHGIPAELIERTVAVSKAFFRRPIEDKRQVMIKAGHRGFLEIGEAKMAGQRKIDFKESFIWGAEFAENDPGYPIESGVLAPNRWPAFQPEMATVLGDFLGQANACGRKMLMAFAAALDIAPDYFVRRFDKPISRGALVYYPPQAPGSGLDQYGVSPHTDYGCLTLVWQDEVGGLRVLGRGGQWLKASPIEGTLVVNVGDLLARWTNDRFRSTEHAVVNSSGRERFSIAAFVDPNWDTPVDPVVLGDEAPHYPVVRCAEHIKSRFDQSFAYRQKS